MKNPFEVLGLPTTATPEQVTAAWRKLCMIHHPDRGGNAVDFCDIRRAYKLAYAQAVAPAPCDTCGRTGKILKMRGFSSIMITCPDCNGTRFYKGG